MINGLSIAALICGSDLAIKSTVKKNVKENSQKALFKDKVILTKYYNEGAALGVLKDKPERLKEMTLLGIGGLLGALWILNDKKGYTLQKFGLSLLLGGALSNGYERLKYGKVTDYVKIHAGCKRFWHVVYNIGDFSIFAGALALLTGELMGFKK